MLSLSDACLLTNSEIDWTIVSFSVVIDHVHDSEVIEFKTVSAALSPPIQSYTIIDIATQFKSVDFINKQYPVEYASRPDLQELLIIIVLWWWCAYNVGTHWTLLLSICYWFSVLLNITFLNNRDVECCLWIMELVCKLRGQGVPCVLYDKLCWTSQTCSRHIPSSPWVFIICCYQDVVDARRRMVMQVIVCVQWSHGQGLHAIWYRNCIWPDYKRLLKVGRVSGVRQIFYPMLFIFQLHF